MRSLTKITFTIGLIFSFGFVASALAQQSAQERAASLRVQLAETQARQVELQARLQALDEALKPENISSGLAGVGSTHPEELREQRRRQLASEKTEVSAQLDQLTASRSRLELSLQEADTSAYHESAAPNPPGVTPNGPNVPNITSVAKSSAPRRPVARRRSRQVKRHKTKTKKPKTPIAPSNQ